MKVKESAFKSTTGEVKGTGACHDVEQLPKDFEVAEEGYLTENGDFVTRDEAKENLAKMQPFPALPKLGVQSNARAVPMVSSKPELDLKNKLLNYQTANAVNFKDPEKQKAFQARVSQIDAGGKAVGRASSIPGSGLSFATSNNLRAKTERGQDPNSPMATQEHEASHLMFNQIAQKYGKKASMNLAHNLYNAIPQEARSHLQHYVASKYGGKEINPSKYHEEHLAHLLNYLNTPSERKVYHESNNHTPEEQVNISSQMKLAHRAVQNAAKQADKKWTSRVMKKSEIDDFNKSQEWKPSFEELELAQDMVLAFNNEMPEFKAACFLTHRLQT